MTTWRVLPSSWSGAVGATDKKISGGTVPVAAANDIYVIDPSVDSSFAFDNTTGVSSPIGITVQFDASNTGMSASKTVTFNSWLNPTVTVASGIDVSRVNISAPSGGANFDQFDLTLGANSTLGYVHVGGSGAFGSLNTLTFTLGDGATVGIGSGDAIAAGGSYIDVQLTAGAGVTLDGDLGLAGSNSSYDVSFGSGATVNGNFTWGGSQNTYTATFGDNFTLDKYFHLGGSGNTQTITFGDNASIGQYFDVGGASNTNTIVFGDNATIAGAVTGSTSGSETWTFGDDWQFASTFTLSGGNDTLVLGSTGRDSSGTISGGSGTDTLVLKVPASQLAAFTTAATAAGWTQNADGSWNTNHKSLTWNGNSFSSWESANTVLCFLAGTRITTPAGDVAVELLEVGDLVVTLDHGAQPIRWIGRRRFDPGQLAARQSLWPVRIEAGALGDGLPSRALGVSPQHRVLVRSRIAQRMFGSEEILVAAKHLVGLPGISVPEVTGAVDYIHLMFSRHEVIFSEQAPTESLYAGSQTLEAMGPGLVELLALFPDLARDPGTGPDPARPLVPGRRARRLVERHLAARQRLLA